MRIINALVQKKWTGFVYFLLAGALMLAACGSNFTTGSPSSTSTTGTASTPSPSPTPTILTIKGYGAPYGCPSDAVVSAAPAATITVRPDQAHTTYSV